MVILPIILKKFYLPYVLDFIWILDYLFLGIPTKFETCSLQDGATQVC